MTWHLFGVIFSGLGLGGIAYLLRSLSRRRLPKWIIPVFAGLGMIGYLAYYDYTWYEFKLSQLPKDSVLIDHSRSSSFFKPWSYISPAVNAFRMTDGDIRIRHQNGTRLAEYLAYEFTKDPTERVRIRIHVLNCDNMELASVDRENPQLGPQITHVSAHDLIYKKACSTR